MVRFERSALLSKTAAMTLLPRGQAALPAGQATLDAIRKRLGGCQRPGAVWLGVLARFGCRPGGGGGRVVEAGRFGVRVVAAVAEQVEAEIVDCLLRFQVAWLDKLGKGEQSARAIGRLLELEDNGDAESLTDLAQWLVDRKAWSGLDELTRRFSARCDHDARLLYLLAEAYAGQGRRSGRKRRAAGIPNAPAAVGPGRRQPPPDGRLAPAARTVRLGQAGIRAGDRRRQSAGGQLRGTVRARGRHLPGRDAPRSGRRPRRRQGVGTDHRALDSPAGGAGRAAPRFRPCAGKPPRHDALFLGLPLGGAARRGQAARVPRQGGKDDPTDPDVLIARYRLPDEPRGYHAKIVESIERNALLIHGEIATSPVPSDYNEYAWLIGNTEGDFEEAVKCSFKSIEISPEEGGLYDTLGHVYFGKGDWEKAVKYQAMAAELDPYSGQIRKGPGPVPQEVRGSKPSKKRETSERFRLGVDLWCEDRGSGLPLLLVHGFPLDHTMWAGQLALAAAAPALLVGERFQSAGPPPARRFLPSLPAIRMIAPDLRGFGRSPARGETVAMHEFADDLAALLDALGVEGPVVYCGLSMGGYIGWQFWRRHRERLRGLIQCDTRAQADTPEAAAARREMADRVVREGPAPLVEMMLPKLLGEDDLPPAAGAGRRAAADDDGQLGGRNRGRSPRHGQAPRHDRRHRRDWLSDAAGGGCGRRDFAAGRDAQHGRRHPRCEAPRDPRRRPHVAPRRLRGRQRRDGEVSFGPGRRIEPAFRAEPLRSLEEDDLTFFDHGRVSFTSSSVYGDASSSIPLIAEASEKTDQAVSSSPAPCPTVRVLMNSTKSKHLSLGPLR